MGRHELNESGSRAYPLVQHPTWSHLNKQSCDLKWLVSTRWHFGVERNGTIIGKREFLLESTSENYIRFCFFQELCSNDAIGLTRKGTCAVSEGNKNQWESFCLKMLEK